MRKSMLLLVLTFIAVSTGFLLLEGLGLGYDIIGIFLGCLFLFFLGLIIYVYKEEREDEE